MQLKLVRQSQAVQSAMLTCSSGMVVTQVLMITLARFTPGLYLP